MDQSQILKKIQKKHKVNAIYAQSVLFFLDASTLENEADKIVSGRPKPFVKWAGGKRQLLRQFHDKKLYPEGKFNPLNGAYFEPFIGGGAVFFDLLPQKAYLSDSNKDLINAFNVVKNNVEELIESLRQHETEREYFMDIRAKDPIQLSPVEAASRFIYLNKTCFNGMYRVNSKGKFNVPFGKYINPLICDEDNLRKVSEVLRNVEIEHRDYKAVLEKAKKGDFVYFDPPYYPLNKTSSFTAYTTENFTGKDHIELRNVFLELHKRGCFVMLSNSNSDFIREIYSEIHDGSVKIHKMIASRMINSKASGRGKIKEILVTNY